jgi:2-keto-4-pentenoate hydratase/2-oxohepta-3-ene-1,7-dioic acid hydratase in catechol pathway
MQGSAGSKCNRSVVGDGADVQWPRGAELMDSEAEVAVVIGRESSARVS